MDREDISVYAKMLYIALSSFAGLAEVRPGHKRLSKIVGCSERKIRDALDELRARDLIEWKVVTTPKGRVSIYRNVQPWTGTPSELGVRQDVPDGGEGPAPDAGRGAAPHAGEITREERKDSLVPPSGPDAEIELRPDVEAVCAHLADRIAANGCKRPTITKEWRRQARLMIDTDGREVAAIHRCIDWCQNDPFWSTNILSMPKLRKQYDQLRLKAIADAAKVKELRPVQAVPAYDVQREAPKREALSW
jgi:hypothetical protein